MTAVRKWLLLPVLIGLLAVSSISAGKPVDPGRPSDATGIDRAREVADDHANFFFTSPNVVGVGVTLTEGGQAAVLVMTAGADDGIVSELDGVPVVHKVTGALTALEGHPTPTDSFARPVPIGISTGNEGECSAGTIGARVKDAAGKLFALSNNHVYALENAAPIGSQVLQPGRFDLYDAGTNPDCDFADPADVLGQLSAFEPLKFKGGFGNKIDAAIASVKAADLRTATPAQGYGTPKSDTVSAVLNEAVQKFGRTTSLTTGTITGINVRVRVGYTSGTAGFSDQIVVQSATAGPVIGPGDSGSLLVTDPAASPVGLMFAGNSSGSMAIANRIDLVLDAFNVTIDGQAVLDVTAPSLASAEVDGTSLVLAYDEALDATSVPATGAFSVGAQSVTDVAVDGANVTLTLSPGADFGDSVTVSYTAVDAGGSPIRDATGNEAADLVNRAVTNNTPNPNVGGVTVLSVAPSVGPPDARLDVTVTGTGFQTGATLDFGAGVQVRRVKVVSDTEITAGLRIRRDAAEGSRDVTVANEDGSSGTLSGGFTVAQNN